MIGRDDDLRHISSLLHGSRLVTLTGPGGVGKTTIATAVASARDDAVVVSLSELSDPAHVPGAIAAAAGARPDDDADLVRRLAGRLLLLDNFEHVTPAASHVERLLDACRSLRILVTSREPLRIAGEHLHPVEPLHTHALELFETRARAVRPDLEPDEDVALEICRRLDDLPLAIEIAAARCGVLSPGDVLARLTSASVMRRAGPGIAARHETLDAAIAWSYDMLDDDERALFHVLSAFPGGCTLDALEAMDVLDDVLPVAISLVERSLVRTVHAGGRTRFTMLHTIRAFAARCAQGTGEAVLTFVRGLCATDDDRDRWFAVLDEERENVRAGLRVAQAGTPGHRDLAVALSPWWISRGHLAEGRAHLEHHPGWPPADLARGRIALHQGDVGVARASLEGALTDGDERVRAWALEGLGALAENAGDYDTARERQEQASSAFAELGDESARAQVLNRLGSIAFHRSDFAEARGRFEAALEITRRIGQTAGIVASLNNLAALESVAGDLAGARSLYDESLALARRGRDDLTLGMVLHNLGEVARREGDLTSAALLLTEGLELARRRGDLHGEADFLGQIGAVETARRDHVRAEEALQQAIVLHRELGDRERVGLGLANRGLLAREIGDRSRAVRLLGEAVVELHAIGDRYKTALVLDAIASVVLPDRAEAASRLLGASERLRDEVGGALPDDLARDREDAIASVVRTIGERRYRRAAADGARLQLEQAIEEALALTDGVTAQPAAGPRDEAVLRRTTGGWTLTYRGAARSLPDERGVRALAVLLARPEQDVHASVLVAAWRGGAVATEADLGPSVDRAARDAYRARLDDLAVERDEAERFGDIARAERVRGEIAALSAELGRAVGLGGRPRRAGSSAERDRINVTRAVKAAVEHVNDAHPALGLDLRATIRTGLYSVYMPQQTSVRWVVET